MEPKKYNEVVEELEKLLYILEEKNEMYNPLAYCNRQVEKYQGTSYRISYNNSNEELGKFLLVHEIGHILFNHLKENKFEKILIRSKLKKAFDENEEFFKSIKIDDEEILLNMLEGYIYNIVMDFQVNSTLFDEEEFNYLGTLMNNFLGTDDARGCWPGDYDFPLGLPWKSYLDYIFKDVKKFFENVAEQEQKKGSDNSDGNPDDNGSNGSDGNGNSDEGSDSNGNSDGSGSDDGSDGSSRNSNNKKLSPEQIGKLIKDAIEKEANKQEAVEEERKKDEEKKSDVQTGFGHGYSNKGTASKDLNICKCEDTKELEEIVFSLLKNRVDVASKKDTMFYYNRGRSDKVLKTKYRAEKRYRNKPITVLLDVSGSVSEDKIRLFVNVFENVSKKLNKECNMVIWNTGYVNSFTNKSAEKNIRTGGGTDMAKGIDYIQNNYKNSFTNFIVSDFEDNINDWNDVISTPFVGICWNNKEILDEILKEQEITKLKLKKVITME